MELTYFNIQKFCIHDGPGIRSTLFVKGCPLDCLWCHNPESKSAHPQILFYESKCTACGRCLSFCPARQIDAQGKLTLNRDQCTLCGQCTRLCYQMASSLCGKTDTLENILAELKKDKPFYDTSGGGITISGGEPALYGDAVLELVKMAKEAGIRSAVETSGFGKPAFYLEMAHLGVMFLFDIKGIDRETHKRNIGVYPDLIHQNLDALISAGAQIILRLPLIPGKNDSKHDLALLTDFLRERKEGILYAEIMPYHSLGRDKNLAAGRAVYDPIPDGKAFAPAWKEKLSQSQVEIRISGE